MAGLEPIVQTFRVVPDVGTLHALTSVLEKHLGALRADLEQFLEAGAAPAAAEAVPEVSPEP
jgi:hypothetical protein